MNFLSYSEYRPPFRTPAFLDSLDSSNPCFSASPLTVRKAQKQLRTVTAFTPTTRSLRPRVLHPRQTAKLATASPNTTICEALPGNLQSLKPHYLSNLYPFKLSSSTFPSSGRILGQNSFSPPLPSTPLQKTAQGYNMKLASSKTMVISDCHKGMPLQMICNVKSSPLNMICTA